jgi:hypothetical protein
VSEKLEGLGMGFEGKNGAVGKEALKIERGKADV